MCYICGLGFWFAIAVGLVLNLSPVYDSVYPEGRCLILRLSNFFVGPAQVPMMSPNGSVPPIYVPPGYISQVAIHALFPSQCFWLASYHSESSFDICFQCYCFFSPLDHRRERSAAGSGFTSATRVPPRGALPSPPSSSTTPCSPACLHPTPCHDAPSTSPVYRHGRGRGRHELPVHLSVPSSSYLPGAGWVGVRSPWIYCYTCCVGFFFFFVFVLSTLFG